MRRWRMYLWPVDRFRPRRRPLAGLGVLHELDAAHGGPCLVGRGPRCSAGAVQLALVRGKLTSRWWTLSLSVSLLVSAARVPDPRAEPVVLLARGVSAPRDRLDAPRRGDLPDRAGDAAAAFAWNAGFAMTWIVLAVMLFCDRDVAPIFGHLSPLAGGPEMRRRLVVGVAVVAALALPATASAHATLIGISPPNAVAVGRAAAGRRASVRPVGHDHARRDRRVRGRTGARCPARRVSGADHRVVRAPLRGLRSRRGVHRALARDLVRRPRTGSGVYTFGIGVTPPPPTEAYGSTGPTWTDDAARWAYFVCLALLLGTPRHPAARAPRAAARASVQLAVRVVAGVGRHRRRSTSASRRS